MMESDAEALQELLYQAKPVRRARKVQKKTKVYSEDDDTPEQDLRFQLHREKLESSMKEHVQTNNKLAETEAKLAETEAKLAETEAKLAETQAELAETQAELAETNH